MTEMMILIILKRDFVINNHDLYLAKHLIMMDTNKMAWNILLYMVSNDTYEKKVWLQGRNFKAQYIIPLFEHHRRHGGAFNICVKHELRGRWREILLYRNISKSSNNYESTRNTLGDIIKTNYLLSLFT